RGSKESPLRFYVGKEIYYLSTSVILLENCALPYIWRPRFDPRRCYQMRSFEVMLACVSNDQGQQQLFSSVPVEADRQRQQLSAVLRDIGATPTTALTVLRTEQKAHTFWVRPQAQVRPVMSW